MSEFIPSEYQEKIFEFVEQGVGNAVVDAKAGSGKTTTAIKALDYMPQNSKVLFVAFNKDIQLAIEERVKGKANVKPRTFHALGFAILKANNPSVRTDDFKYKSFVNQNINELSGGVYPALDHLDKQEYMRSVLKLLDLSRYNMAQTKEEIVAVAEKYGVSLEGTEPTVVEQVLQWGAINADTIDFTDMVWLPCELGLKVPTYLKFDWIIVDEAQDASPVQQRLVKKCYKKNTRFMAIGDTSQAINAWCGGDEDAFNNFLKEDNTTEFSLPISYRCPLKVIKLAQNFEPDIMAAPGAAMGEVNYDVSPFKARNGDMVLCRNTIPLTKLYSDYLKKDIKCFIRGADIGKGLITLIENTKKDTLNASLLGDGVIPVLYKRLFKILNKTMEQYGLRMEDAVETLEFSTLYDSIKTIEILSEGYSKAQEVTNRIKSIFTDTMGNGICLSTVHKAKGLESDNVFILCPSLMPSQKATQPWEVISEENIQYVAITRAKKTLNYVDERLFPPSKGYADADSIVSDLTLKATYLQNIYGKNPLTGAKGIATTSLHMTRSGGLTGTTRPVSKKKIGANKFKNFLK